MSVLGRPEVVGDRAVETAMRWSRLVVVAGLAVAVLVALLPVAPSGSVVVALSVVGLLVGLPHGSVDHLVAARLTGWPVTVVAAAYAVAAAVSWLLLTGLGVSAVVAVLVLSLAHFGAGEVALARATTGWHPTRAVVVAMAVAGTGALLLPLARAGDLVAEVASGVSPQLGVLLAATPVRLGLAAVWVVAAAVAVVAAVRARRPGVVIDVLLVGALGALAPPLLAFALWFGGWHGLRHCARLLSLDECASSLLARGRGRAAVLVLVRQAALPTLAATATLTALVAFTVTAPDGVAATSATLVVLLALTVPHMLVVGWLDLRAAREQWTGVPSG